MYDLSYFDGVVDNVPNAETAQSDEMSKLVAVAKYIPLLEWVYDPSKINTEDEQPHLGFVTQALLKVPGLASAVTTDENGVQQFDSRMVAAASLSLVAALARHVLGIKLDEGYSDEVR